MSDRIRNVVSGELIATETNVQSRAGRRVWLRDFCKLMNAEHRAGSDHVREFHDGVEQRYRIVKVPDDD